MPQSSIALLATLLVLALRPTPALGNSAAPLGYDVTVTDATVRVCPARYHDVNPCGQDGLLRRDTRTGAIVLLDSCAEQGCFVDECVPPGSYQYGLRTPFQCCSACSGTYYYADVTTSASVSGCLRARPAPTAYSAVAPWADNKLICDYKGMIGCASTAATVLSGNALLLLLGLGVAVWTRCRRGLRGS